MSRQCLKNGMKLYNERPVIFALQSLKKTRLNTDTSLEFIKASENWSR
jgi:hypothetical protein